MLWPSNKDNGVDNAGGNAAGEASDDQEELKEAVLAPPLQGRTLLPTPAAAVISGITGLTSFYVRAGTKVGGWGLYAGREATLKTLSVSRSALEAILVAAGRDVSSRSNGDLRRAEAENLLEKSVRLDLLHSHDAQLTVSRFPRCTRPFQPFPLWHPQASTSPRRP